MTINGFVKCTCPMHCQTGHCPHKYAVEEILGLKVHVGEQILVASGGAERLRSICSVDAGSSADEGSPLPHPKVSVRRIGSKVARNPSTNPSGHKREAGAQQDQLSAKRQKRTIVKV